MKHLQEKGRISRARLVAFAVLLIVGPFAAAYADDKPERQPPGERLLPGNEAMLDPQPLPPGDEAILSPLPLRPGDEVMINPRMLTTVLTAT